MQVIQTGRDMRRHLKTLKREGKSVGFVPTMGFLHEGHISLMKKARMENDIVVVSIFVNPTQFNDPKDLDTYPTDIDSDLAKTAEADVDYVFFPTVDEMYPQGYNTYVEVDGGLTEKLCGATRPGHFRGVTTVVNKLFNLAIPDRAYFGMKDAQQVAVIQRMVEDLNMDLEIVPCPIVREADGLAMSSRNSLLTPKEREDALVLSKSLNHAREEIEAGERRAEKVRTGIVNYIRTVEEADIDYVEIVNARSLESIETIEGDVLIALAVKIGKPRLIDNLRMEVQ